MPSYTTAQRGQINQFVSFTQAKESIAAKFLKNHNWNVETAVDAFYHSGNATPPPQGQATLGKLFDNYRDDPKPSPDKIGISGAQTYLSDLHIALDDISLLCLSELLQCPTLGEFDREPFISGWQSVATNSPGGIPDTIPKQSAHASTLRRRLTTDVPYFKKVYRYAFYLAKPAGQKSVPMESALEFWSMFFSSSKGGVEWNGSGKSTSTRWLDEWLRFYEEKGKRPVNKDLWNMVYELMVKTKEPGGEDLAWWTEDGAWPMAIDDFISHVKAKRGSAGDPAGAMDTT